MTDERTESAEQDQEQADGGLAPNDPEQSGDAAELTDEQKAALEANATQGEQGPQVREQDPTPTGPQGFDPDRPVASSPPPPDAQSGVPALPNGENAGVEPQPEYAKGTDGNDTTRAAEGGAAVTEGASEPSE